MPEAVPQCVYYTHQSSSPQKFPTLWNLTAALSNVAQGRWVRSGNTSRLLSNKLIFEFPAYQLLGGDCFYPEVNESWLTAQSELLPSCQRGRNVQVDSVHRMGNLLFTPLLIMWRFAYMQNRKWLSTFLSVLFLEWSRKVCLARHEVGGIVILTVVMKQTFTDIKQVIRRHRELYFES